MPVDSEGRWQPGTEIRAEWTYDISYVLAPDGETIRTRRVAVVDPNPQPGMGPAIATIHRALRSSDPTEFGHMQHPDELVIVKVREATDEA